MIDNNILLPPSKVRGCTALDKDAFTKVISVPYFTISSDFNKCLTLLKSYFLKMECFKPVQDSSEGKHKKDVLLNPTLISTYQDFQEVDRSKLKDVGLSETDLKWKEISLKYENWKADTILKAVLPEDVANITGYSIVGHIVHLNLKDEHLPFKNVIGNVLLDKIKNVRTVVSKVNSICNTYRNFSMEILAGEKDTLVTVKENGCTFQFDFSLVYWNSRLSTEHERIVNKLKANDILFDVFAGVGPFAVPAGKKQCCVYANDLNPESSRWLSHNINSNRVSVHVSTLDGRKFITNVVKPEILRIWRSDKVSGKIHIVMNLPAMAVEFLDVFKSLFKDDHVDKTKQSFLLPIVHCYCFVKGTAECEAVARQMVGEHLECELKEQSSQVAFVRNVAPNKEMFRVSFELPDDVLFGGDVEKEPCAKKVKLTE